MIKYEKEFEKLKTYIKNISVGQYDENGVNIGFKSAEDVIKDYIHQCLLRQIDEDNKRFLGMIDERINYEKKYRVGSYNSGFSGSESGECCDKCRMEDKHFNGHADALKAVVGCRNPFQIESTCQCHIPFRKIAVATKLKTLEELRDKVNKK